MKSLRVNDTVKVIAGGFKGTEAVITAIDRARGKATLESVGARERHYRKSYMRPQGGKATVSTWIDLSNLKLVTPATKDVKKTAKKAEKADAKDKKGAK